MFKRIATTLNTKPLAFLSTVFGLRDIFVGLALLFPSEYQNTVLARNLNELGGVRIYALLLTLIGLAAVLSIYVRYPKYTRACLTAAAWFWLFAGMSYLVNGHWTFALANFLMCCAPTGYIAFYYKWFPNTDK